METDIVLQKQINVFLITTIIFYLLIGLKSILNIHKENKLQNKKIILRIIG